MPDYEKCCGNCIWNEDLLCDKKGRIVKDSDRACPAWEGEENGERNIGQRRDSDR